jgi:copper(I)-binding protein
MPVLIPTRRLMLKGGVALCAGVALPQAQACEFFTGSLRILHPWTRATRPGDSTAMVGLQFDEVQQADRLIGAQTMVAEGAEIAGSGKPGELDFEIPAGRITRFDEFGPHLRLLNLRQPLLLNRSYPLRLEFQKGGVILTTLSVDYEAA